MRYRQRLTVADQRESDDVRCLVRAASWRKSAGLSRQPLGQSTSTGRPSIQATAVACPQRGQVSQVTRSITPPPDTVHAGWIQLVQ